MAEIIVDRDGRRIHPVTDDDIEAMERNRSAGALEVMLALPFRERVEE